MEDKQDNMKISVYIATSLDGFIARENGDLDWLPGSDGEIAGEDYGFYKFIESIDTLVMGCNTYEMVISLHAAALDDPEQGRNR